MELKNQYNYFQLLYRISGINCNQCMYLRRIFGIKKSANWSLIEPMKCENEAETIAHNMFVQNRW